MDAGTALSLAQTVWQLVFLGLDFVNDTKQVYNQGSTDVNLDLGTAANNIQGVTKSLEAQLEQPIESDKRSDGKEIDIEDEELYAIAIRASEIGKELVDALRKSQVHDQKSMFKAFTAVARSRWDARDIKQIEGRLSSIQIALQLRVIVSIKKKVDHQPDEKLQETLKALERVLDTQSISRDDVRHMMNLLDRNAELEESRHGELIASLSEIKASTASRSLNPVSRFLELPQQETKEAKLLAETVILNSLWYQSMHDREDSIYHPYQRTFEWLFQNPGTSAKPWDSFVDFLQGNSKVYVYNTLPIFQSRLDLEEDHNFSSDQDCRSSCSRLTRSSYWITGKPGSGKSTVMKYLREDPRTTEYLQLWAAGKELRLASFYFFYNGTDMQKSEIGLLISLLHTLLAEDRSLISVAFEEKYHAALHHSGPLSCPSVPEAKRALRDVFRSKQNIRFFFTIDGLDEFDPSVSHSTVTNLLNLTGFLADFPNVKLVLSSRPEPAFEDKFALYKKLTVHDLTRDDIRVYVRENLEKDPRMKELVSRDKKSRELVDSIVGYSSGVFLWVRLVTESLIDGLTDGDGIQELRQRTEDLPRDLHELYRAMLLRVEPRHLSQTAKLLQLVECSGGLSVMGLWFAENASEELVCQTHVSPISDEEVKYHVEQMEHRVKSRCKGLIEIKPNEPHEKREKDRYEPGHWFIEDSDIYDTSNRHMNAKAMFIHKSVVDFLQKDDIRAQFIKHPDLNDYSPELALLYNAIFIIKTFRLDIGMHWSVLLRLANMAGHWAANAQRVFRPCARSLDALDIAMTEHLAEYKASPNRLNGKNNPFEDEDTSQCHWTAWYDFTKGNQTRTFTSFAAFAISHGLIHYLKHKVAKYGPQFLQNVETSLLGHAVLKKGRYYRSKLYPEIVNYLIEMGSRPTDHFLDRDIWHEFIGCVSELERIVVLLKERGAIEQEWDQNGNLIFPPTTDETPSMEDVQNEAEAHAGQCTAPNPENVSAETEPGHEGGAEDLSHKSFVSARSSALIPRGEMKSLSSHSVADPESTRLLKFRIDFRKLRKSFQEAKRKARKRWKTDGQ
ncbi:hypothetical protein F5B20DRAFT_585718 [Whalleya microplaca]|nr:hypothetical protein F5B20DRAFT_585718 [Whalleya microplaca]